MMDVSQYSHTWWQGFHVKYICQLENPLFSPQCSIIYSLLTVTLTARIQNPLLKLTTTHYFPAAKARMNFTTKNWSNLLKSLPVQKRMFASEIISKKCVNIFPLVFFLFLLICLVELLFEPCRYFQPARQLGSWAATVLLRCHYFLNWIKQLDFCFN